MKGKISAKGIRVRVLRQLIELHNALYERYEAYEWKESNIYPDFKNYLWSQVKEEDVMDILSCSKRTAHDYLAVLKKFVG
jgi:TolB-like protein